MSATVARLAPLVRFRGRLRLALVVYGLAVAVLAGFHLDSHLPPARQLALEGTRLQGAQLSLKTYNSGGTTLIGYDGKRYSVIGVADDPGFYVYVPYIAHLTHVNDIRVVMRWSYIVLTGLLIAVAPFAFSAITGSALSGIVAPLLVYYQFRFLDNTDIYWVNAWAILLLLPLVFAVYRRRRWTWWSLAALTFVTLVASWASSIRLYSGLPVALAAAVVALVRQPGRWAKAGAVVLLAAAYLAVYPASFQPTFTARDKAAAQHGLAGPVGSGRSFSDLYPRSHLTWHNIYIGLGYLPNPYGISWLDQVGIEAAQRYDPGVVYATKRYERDMRHLVLQIARSNPGFVWRNIEMKSRFELGQAFHDFGWALLLLPAVFGLGRSRRRELLLYLALTVPALILTFLPPVLTVPINKYSISFYATAGLVWLLAATWFVGVTGPELTARTLTYLRAAPAGVMPPTRDLLTRRNGIALGLTVAAAIAIAYRPPLRHSNLRAYGPAGAPAELVATGEVRGHSLAAWRFGARLPKGWRVLPGVGVTRQAEGIEVTTTEGHFQYQLMGPTRTLDPGRYNLAVSGAVTTGGLNVGILNSTRNSWIAQDGYSEDQHFRGHLMVTSFILRRTTTVRVVFSNWLAADGVSTWTLRSARLLATASGR